MRSVRAPGATAVAAVLATGIACLALASPRPAAAQDAPAAGQAHVTVYRCVADDGGVTLRDTPCAKGARQEARSMVRPADAPPAPAREVAAAPAPAAAAADAPPRVVVVREAAPTPMYECTTPDNTTYTSDSPEGNPRWVPMWTLGWPVPAGTWVRDECRRMQQAETCARLRDRRDAIERRFFNAMPSERARLETEERGIDARLGADCGAR
ncbi:MAG: hypothetical protein ACTHOC_11990 [Luteimonas sp.]